VVPGATVPIPSAPTTGSAAPPATDIRSRVDDDRGILKKLQLLIPGFRGYRQGEDLRDADSILRREIADRLLGCLKQLQQLRQTLAQANQYGAMNSLALILSDLTVLEGRVRHAEQGYSGFSAPIRVTPDGLERLYEYDYGFVLASQQLTAQLLPLIQAARGNDAAGITSEVGRLRDLTSQFQNAFQVRMTTIEGIQV
jgi:hypothetical protein